MKYFKIIIASILGSTLGVLIMTQLEGNIAFKFLLCFLGGWALGDMLKIFNHK